MTKWNPPETAPKNRSILVYGKPTNVCGDNPVTFNQSDVYLAYWDEIDESFCLKGGGWLGPFIKPEVWAEQPSPPSTQIIFG